MSKWCVKIEPVFAVNKGLLDRSTAGYFYERLKTSLHKPTGNLLENLFFLHVI
jgi:hypothetical protein